MDKSARIVVGVGESIQTLSWALTEAGRRGAEMHAVRAWFDAQRPGPLSNVVRRQLADAAMTILTERLSAVMNPALHDVSMRLVVLEGRASDVLTSYANRPGDLLVLGAGQHHPLWTLGSRTVRRCVRTAQCPVVVLPATSERRLLRELRRDLKQLDRLPAELFGENAA